MDPIRVGDILDGKYQIEGTLGEGAMGVVFSARHTALNKRVAVKTLRPEIARDKALVGRFEQEARAASAIGHPNIIEVFDLGSAPNGARYMVMEHLRGEALADSIVREPIQSLERVVFMTQQILSALAAAHKRGIVHRDLKPENIFVVRIEDRPDTIKLLDFGISKVLAEVADPRIAGGDSGARQTKLGTVLGTPLYMSPEQARGLLDIDHRTDLWAVAVCMYEMLTGRPPFDGQNYNQIMGAILSGKFPNPREINPSIPEAMAKVIVKGLAYQREQRFQSATEMRKAIDAASQGIAPPPQKRATAPTAAMTGTPAPGAAAVITGGSARPGAATSALPSGGPAAAAPKPASSGLQSGLAAAANASHDSDAQMLSALDKIASGDVDMGFAAAPAAPPLGTPAPTPAPAPRAAIPAAAKATGAPMKAPARAASAKPAEDLFAPPSSDNEVIGLALDVEPTAPRRAASSASSASSAPVADFRSTAGANAAPKRRTGSQTVATSGGGFGRFIVALAALVIVGAGGLATYRYLTLGYIFTAPAVPSATIALTLSPAEGELIVDGLAFPGDTLELPRGKPRTVRAMATGRVQHEVTVVYAEGGEPPPPLELELRYKIPPWNELMVPAFDDRKGPAAAAGMEAHDQAVDKLDRFRGCLAPLREEVAGRYASYVATTRRKAKHIARNNIPKIKPLPVDLLSTCRAAVEAAATDQPAFPEIDGAVLAVMPGISELDQVLKSMAAYYGDEKYRNDRLRFGRKQHPVLMSSFKKADELVVTAADMVADRRAYWQTVELSDIEASEGQSAHWRLRRLMYAAQAWVGAEVRGLPAADKKARASAFAELYESTTTWALANDAAMKQITGAGIFISSLGELAKRAAGGERDEKATPDIELLGGAARQFNEMVL